MAKVTQSVTGPFLKNRTSAYLKPETLASNKINMSLEKPVPSKNGKHFNISVIQWKVHW